MSLFCLARQSDLASRAQRLGVGVLAGLSSAIDISAAVDQGLGGSGIGVYVLHEVLGLRDRFSASGTASKPPNTSTCDQHQGVGRLTERCFMVRVLA
jgi:hypothetical protein